MAEELLSVTLPFELKNSNHGQGNSWHGSDTCWQTEYLDRTSWFAARKSGIGASESATQHSAKPKPELAIRGRRKLGRNTSLRNQAFGCFAAHPSDRWCDCNGA